MRSSRGDMRRSAQQAGFTLVEIVVGIVVMAVAMTYMVSILTPQAIRSVRPVMEVKAAELASGLMNEILAKSYDENSDHNGSQWRCGESIAGLTIAPCTTVIGPESGETRVLYDDVDDYDSGGTYRLATQFNMTSGQSLATYYPNFSVKIAVNYAAGFSGNTPSQTSIAKRIDIFVRLPEGDEFVFSAYRGNY